MIDSTTFTDPLCAPFGHLSQLRLHTPDSEQCPFAISTQANIANLSELNHAFQQLTGWNLRYRETGPSFRIRNAIQDPTASLAGRLEIADLSELLPPGVPATSRIYTEKLVDEFNEILAELDKARTTVVEQEKRIAELVKVNTNTTRKNVNASVLFDTPCNIPLINDNVAITPVSMDPLRTACEWFVDVQGRARFAMMICLRSDHMVAAELIAARTTFLAECRHGSDDLQTHIAIRETIARVFPGGSMYIGAVGTLDPLTGELSFTGGEQFRLNSTQTAFVRPASKINEVSRFYLHRGQHIVFSRWPIAIDDERVDDWLSTSVRSMRGLPCDELTRSFGFAMVDAIPGLASPPQIAVAISRI